MCGIVELDGRTLRSRTIYGMLTFVWQRRRIRKALKTLRPSPVDCRGLITILASFLLCTGLARGKSGNPSSQQTGAEVRTVAGAEVTSSGSHAVRSDAPRRPSGNDHEVGHSEVTDDAPAPNSIPPDKEERKKSGPDPNVYIIGEQDSLLITIWKEKDISGGVVVRPDGKITVPLVGEITVVGMTPVQLQNVLAEKLKPFVTVPQVTVAVTDIRSRRVYLIGRAVREGTFTINSSTTVLQIIAQVGGLKDFAKRKKIYILRQHGTEQVRFPFNFDDVIRGRHTEQNILLEPGDTIVVP